MNYNSILKPKEFTGHSLSVSDIIALCEHSVITYYYVDRIGFQQLPNFHETDNPLRSLEDSVEQNDNNLDGAINNLPSAKQLDITINQSQQIMMQEQMRRKEESAREKMKSIREKVKIDQFID